MRKRTQLTDKQVKALALAGLIAFIVLCVLIFIFVGVPLLKFLASPARFRDWVNSNGVFGRLAFLGMMMLQIFIALMPGEPMEICAGYAFGFWEGSALCLLGAVIGGTLVFMFVRAFGRKAVNIFFSEDKIKSISFLSDPVKRDVLVFVIFLIPGTPKDLITYFVGLTDMKLSTWILINSVARIPSVITSTMGGDAMGTQKYWFAAIVFAVSLAITIAGLFIYRNICRRNSKSNADPADDRQDGSKKPENV